jgi:hypothetical protein
MTPSSTGHDKNAHTKDRPSTGIQPPQWKHGKVRISCSYQELPQLRRLSRPVADRDVAAAHRASPRIMSSRLGVEGRSMRRSEFVATPRSRISWLRPRPPTLDSVDPGFPFQRGAHGPARSSAGTRSSTRKVVDDRRRHLHVVVASTVPGGSKRSERVLIDLEGLRRHAGTGADRLPPSRSSSRNR